MKQIIKAAIVTGAMIIGSMPISLANVLLTSKAPSNDMLTNNLSGDVALINFSDVNQDGLYGEAIYSLVEKGVLKGYSDNTFRANKKMTRAEFAKVFVVANELKKTSNNENQSLEDISNHWAKEYIEIAFSSNIIEGYPDKTFKPEKEITYGEVLTILLKNLMLDDKTLELNSELEWPQNYMNLAGEIGLLNGIATNDMVGINSARRDNVALMLWNQIKYKADIDAENKIENESNTNSELDNEKKPENSENKINTKEKYFGVVLKTTLRRGETYITVRDLEGNEEEIQLYKNSKEPKLQSFIIYTLTSNGKMQLKKQLLVEDIEDVSMYVEAVDKELAIILGQGNLLDLELDEYVYADEEIKLNKYTYYLVKLTENDKQQIVFDTFEEIEKEDIKLKEKDRLCFDEDTKTALIIRGLEERKIVIIDKE